MVKEPGVTVTDNPAFTNLSFTSTKSELGVLLAILEKLKLGVLGPSLLG